MEVDEKMEAAADLHRKYEHPVEMIRKRTSYSNWKGWIMFFEKKPSLKEILKAIHREIDDRRGYGSQRNSDYSFESLELVMDENGWLND